jgi:hypothetical protein
MIKDIGRSEGNTEKSRGKQHAGKFREDTGIIKEMQLVSKEIRGDLEEIQEEPKEIHCYPEWKIQGDTGRFGGETWNSRTNEKRTKGDT